MDVGANVSKWPSVVAGILKAPKKLKWGSQANETAKMDQNGCSLKMLNQTELDAFVTSPVKEDYNVNVPVMSLQILTKDLVTCGNNCGREWDGFAQCSCWLDCIDGFNKENNDNQLTDSL